MQCAISVVAVSLLILRTISKKVSVSTAGLCGIRSLHAPTHDISELCQRIRHSCMVSQADRTYARTARDHARQVYSAPRLCSGSGCEAKIRTSRSCGRSAQWPSAPCMAESVAAGVSDIAAASVSVLFVAARYLLHCDI